MSNQPFLMAIEDIFSVIGKGTVIAGTIDEGAISVGDEIEIVGIRDTRKTVCTGIEISRKPIGSAEAGDKAEIIVSGLKKSEVERGQVLATPGSIKAHTKFQADIHVFSKDEGGRHTPFYDGYRPQYHFRTIDVTGTTNIPKELDFVMPGKNYTVTVELVTPIAMNEGSEFAIREGGRTVASGVVTKIID